MERVEYRVIEFTDAHDFEARFRVQLCLAAETGSVAYVNPVPTYVHGQTMAEVKQQADLLLAAFEKPVVRRTYRRTP